MVWKGLWCWIRILESSSASLQGWREGEGGAGGVAFGEERRRILAKRGNGREKCEGKSEGGKGRANLSGIAEDTTSARRSEYVSGSTEAVSEMLCCARMTTQCAI